MNFSSAFILDDKSIPKSHDEEHGSSDLVESLQGPAIACIVELNPVVKGALTQISLILHPVSSVDGEVGLPLVTSSISSKGTSGLQ